ncbi:MAG TPA: hypothetical protein VLA43_11420 [Longimicrobiales bacterium]|nr:hypothetical protein [Longimicrobiales bacterium]
MRRRSKVMIAAGLVIGGAWACTSMSASETHAPVPARFILEAPGGGSGTVWVQLNDALDHPGWVRVAHASGERVYLEERCDVEDCGQPGGVCGMAFPMVLSLSAAGAVEYEWDGRRSVVDAAAQCEILEPAPPGEYRATFCWGSDVSDLGQGDPARGVPGMLQDPVCQVVTFTLPGDTEVRYRIPAP